MKTEELINRVNYLTPWPTSIYLKDDIWTRPGVNMMKTSWYVDAMEEMLITLKDKKILDIGSNTGYVALECALRGATVFSIEPHLTNYERCKLVYESRGMISTGQITLSKDDMEKINIDTFGKLDGIMFCGTIYHCSEPWDILKKYSDMSDNILVESRLCMPDQINDTYGSYKFKREFEKASLIGNGVLHRTEDGIIRKPTRETLYKMMYNSGYTKIKQLMPFNDLTSKYQKEECVAFIGSKKSYKKPLLLNK